MGNPSLTRLMALAVSLAVMGVGCENVGPVEFEDVTQRAAPQFISLLSAENSLPKVLTSSGEVTKKDGGNVKLYHSQKESSIDLNLAFPSDAVSRTITAYVTLDFKKNSTSIDLTFSPSPMVFSKAAKLYIYATGLDLSEIPEGASLKLYYYNPEKGQWEKMDAKISWSRSQGWLKCQDGKIPHFSRYAFGY